MKKYKLNKKGKKNLGLMILLLKNIGIIGVMIFIYLCLGMLVTIIETI